MRIFGSLFLLLSVISGCSGKPTIQRHEFVEMVMASPVRIVLYTREEATARQAARAAFDRMHALERTLSDWIPDSESNRLEQASPEFMELSCDLRHAISMAKCVWRKTDGAFDPTVGPVVELWRETRSSGRLPSDERLQAARMRVDFKAVQLEGKSGRITRPDVELDFGGIGKGIALDEAARILREHELTRHLIDFGGEILVGDPPPGRTLWRLEITPLDTGPPIELAVVRQSIATSGDLHQFVVVDGIRYGHIIDPATGLGTTTGRQATVISEDSAGIADALATAGCVLEPGEFKAILMRDFPGTSAVIASKEEGRTVVTMIGNPPVRASDVP